MSFFREDLKAKAVEILETEVNQDPIPGSLIERIWGLLEESYYEGFAAGEGEDEWQH